MIRAGPVTISDPFGLFQRLRARSLVALDRSVGRLDGHGLRIEAAAEGYDGSDDLTEEIQKFVKSQTAPYKYPRRIEYVTDLPKTSNGKIRRIELR